MYSILDIDLDYFNQVPDAAHRLEQLLNWAACPVSMVVECHNHAFARWRKRWRTHAIAPSHILHVDEHHDMMDQRQQTNIANFMFHAMRMWPSAECIGWCSIPSTRPPCGWKTKRGTRYDSGSVTGLTAPPGGRSQMLSQFARVLTSLLPTWRRN